MSQPTAHLSDEHQWILRMMTVIERACTTLERGASVSAALPGDAVTFIREYADAWHHAKEEELLFPLAESCGIPRMGPIGMMLHEHDEGRAYTAEMAAAVAAGDWDANAATRVRWVRGARAFAGLLRAHIDKEDHILYPMCDQVIDADQYRDLWRRFQEAEARLGTDTPAKFQALVQRYEAATT